MWKITDNYGTIYYFGGEGTEYSYLSDYGINVPDYALRAFVEEYFPDALLYTYTFDPTVGILSETSPNGCVTTYNYDSYRRLSSIKNHLGQTLKDFKYNYCR